MAGLFSQATLEQIRAASDIVDVIGSYLPLKRAGANFTALCPFHKEKSPSFNVNPSRQIFHCFGCHKGGDVFTFVKEYENIGFTDAVRRLAERAKIPIEFDNRPGEQQARHLKDQFLQIHEQITQRWQNCLANEAAGQLARDYLKKRGVSDEAIKLFRIGAAPETWDDTVNWSKSKGHDLALVEKAGLVIRKEETGNYYDRFRGRLMFPICDEQGRVIGFSGRILSGDEKTAKYVNSPETAIFTKSKVFFGLDKSKRAILDADIAIVCEGQLDLIACFMAGVKNVVAPQGTAFTAQHARILKRYAEKIVLCFDSDNAGQNATTRSLDPILEAGHEILVKRIDKNYSAVGRISQKIIQNRLPEEMSVAVAIMPAPHDPDSFIREFGVAAFQQLINNAPDFFDYYLDRLCETNDPTSNRGRRTISQVLCEAISKTGSDVLLDTYAQKTALRIGVSIDAVRAEFKKISHAKPVSTEVDEESNELSIEIQRPSMQELWLLRLLLLHDELVGSVALYLDVNWISHPIVRQIVLKRLAAYTNETWRNMGDFLDQCETPEMRNLITEVVTENRQILNVEQQLIDLIKVMRNQFLDRRIAACVQRLSHPDISDDERMKLLHEREVLRRQKQQPLTT